MAGELADELEKTAAELDEVPIEQPSSRSHSIDVITDPSLPFAQTIPERRTSPSDNPHDSSAVPVLDDQPNQPVRKDYAKKFLVREITTSFSQSAFLRRHWSRETIIS